MERDTCAKEQKVPRSSHFLRGSAKLIARVHWSTCHQIRLWFRLEGIVPTFQSPWNRDRFVEEQNFVQNKWIKSWEELYSIWSLYSANLLYYKGCCLYLYPLNKPTHRLFLLLPYVQITHMPLLCAPVLLENLGGTSSNACTLTTAARPCQVRVARLMFTSAPETIRNFNWTASRSKNKTRG